MKRRWRCCACCEGSARTDHVGEGGDVEKDMHDEPCTLCGQRPFDDSHYPEADRD